MKRIAIVVAVLIVALGASLVTRAALQRGDEPLVVVHWANSHPMREGLMPAMAERFNDDDHETASGRPIEVVVVECDSVDQTDDLVARIAGSGNSVKGCNTADDVRSDNPTIVTPQSSDWLIDVNRRAGREVVDIESAPHIAETWLGIVTYREMAECLGWPERSIGYADIIALRNDPDGWARYPDCARIEWGRPKLAFTNPSTSTSGRNVLVSLYTMAADKSPADLTVDDVTRPDVVQFVRDFQDLLVDHYMPGTIPLNTKITQGVEYGHFFLMPEDNLVSLYLGNAKAIAPDGTTQPVSGISDLVMVYPAEGSVLNANPAAVVEAAWVTPEDSEAASEWIDFLLDNEQQTRFMEAGFRPTPTSSLTPDPTQFAEWGLDQRPPTTTIEPGDLDPVVLETIVDSWGAVKNPAIVTFVVDTSGSMDGDKLAQVQLGLSRMLDEMSLSENPGNDSQVGLVTFSNSVHTAVPPQPLGEARYDLGDQIRAMQASGGTALYDAVAHAVTVTDAVDGDPRAKRSVVVLSDGQATEGSCLSDLVSMMSRREVAISSFCGMDGQSAFDDNGNPIAAADILADSLAIDTEHPIQVFFVGFGEADVQIGRILAQATGAEYQGSTDDDLATVIEELSGYF